KKEEEGVEVKKDPEVAAPQLIDGKWELLELIGEGGMGNVHRARHVVMNKIGAVKLLHRHLIQGKNLQRFQQEAQAAAAISHPSVIGIFDCGVMDDGRAYLVMEYLSGKSLSQTIQDEGPMNFDRATDIFMQICDGLAIAHAQGIVHRDLKPSNIMLVKD